MIARLSIAGANLVTVTGVDSPGLRRGSVRPAVLIADEASFDKDSATILKDPRWHRILVLTASPTDREAGPDARVAYVPRDATAVFISEHVPGWRPEPVA